MANFMTYANKIGVEVSQRVQLWRNVINAAGPEMLEYPCFHVCGYDYLVDPDEKKAKGIKDLFLKTNSLLQLNMSPNYRSRALACLESAWNMTAALDIAAEGAYRGQGVNWLRTMKESAGKVTAYSLKFDDIRRELCEKVSQHWDDTARLGLGKAVRTSNASPFIMRRNPLFTGQVTRARSNAVH